ncbi:MmcQ/YjbR family DNA-binding protein [Phenylobacterium montanum]|uniref:MmcQ/YjbR family DNA-binding protein n=1 Tax=Phenylobacterium montanum TaxID=2823693 RepID=A0A975IV23_9CAUL|nr:MmcQ/YjbR family DNA-binding protein [Caulobacter sp. S6]QUD88547.1 MmcQ/YjbR family DNA-binding protein [Caulobacter sp. S6]
MTEDDIRRIALAQPQAEEADHHGMPSFRVCGKIFCTLHQDRPRAMVKLDAEDQANLAAGHPGVIEPVPGYWGRKGSTFVWHEKVDMDLMRTLIEMAWRNVAPAKLRTAPRGP